MFRLDFKVKRSGYLCTRIFDGQFVGAVAMVIKDPETDDSDANTLACAPVPSVKLDAEVGGNQSAAAGRLV